MSVGSETKAQEIACSYLCVRCVLGAVGVPDIRSMMIPVRKPTFKTTEEQRTPDAPATRPMAATAPVEASMSVPRDARNARTMTARHSLIKWVLPPLYFSRTPDLR